MNFKRMIPMMMIASAPLAGMAQGKAGIIESNLDRSANPAEDFYQFATGGWQKANPLPAAYSRFGSFDQLQENNNKRINGILSELLKKTTPRARWSRNSATSTSSPWTPCAATARAWLP